MDSFMGVNFGASLYDVEGKFPAGVTETSPYGAPAFRLENISSSATNYQDVIFEFAENSGMQMVIAHFPASSSAAVYQQLQNSFGPPSSSGGLNPSDASTVEASWQMVNGSAVLFSGPYHRLTIIGRDGGTLKPDIRLRDTDVPLAQ
ncbi:MAG TPA: hypothetical protein VN867_04625 [Candidatus Binataceae bacterium]|nr:hypothetical protein [Candidatus Binataceae bacterium]